MLREYYGDVKIAALSQVSLRICLFYKKKTKPKRKLQHLWSNITCQL